jgi:hypothetical protein
MKTKRFQCARGRIFILLVCVIAALLCIFPFGNQAKEGGRYAITASAYGDDLIAVEEYAVDMQVQTSRKVLVSERITVRFLDNDLTMFYRSLPTQGCVYEDFTASCAGNSEFYFEVADNPDMSGFIDVNCIGGVAQGRAWTYEISYTMLQGVETEEGMTIDVIGFGWSVPLHNVTATVHFPDAVQDTAVYVGHYGTEKQYPYTLSDDNKTLTLKADCLDIVYNSTYGEYMAKGITVDFTLGEGVLDSYADTRIFTEHIWKLLLGAAVCVGVGALLAMIKKRRDMVKVLSVKPPKGMSPMEMGKILDGTVDNEDVTSMIYYFAHKGWLDIDLEDEKNPLLIKKIDELPKGESAPAKTLFKGLFKKRGVVSIEDLKYKFCEEVDKARLQTKNVKMYDGKSVFGYFVGGLVGVALTVLTLFIFGVTRLNGYTYGVGMITLVPIGAHLLLGFIRENYRYKWKKSG